MQNSSFIFRPFSTIYGWARISKAPLMQREFIISWSRCEWITNQAFPKYVWLQNGTKVLRKSHFNCLCICMPLPCPFTGPKMFCAGPNFLASPKNLIAFSASSKTFVPAQKPILLNANHLFVWHKMFVTATICK